MMTRSILSRILWLTLLLAPAAAPYDWRPIEPANLALAAPKLDPNADAEVIFWDVRILDEIMARTDSRASFTHYVRIKVYNDRGVESQSTVDLTWSGKDQITDIEGRTIKPDGSSIELENKAVFERTVAKGNDLKLKSKSFSMPAVEPGAIIEYKYKHYRGDQNAHKIRLDFQRDLPVWHIQYHIKPVPVPGYRFQAQRFQVENTPFAEEPLGYYMTEARDIPAFTAEPRMPPEAAVRPWLFVYYSKTQLRSMEDVEKEWLRLGKELHKDFMADAKVDGDIKKAIVPIIGDATTPEEKINRIVRYCRNEIKNVFHDRFGFTTDQREEFIKKRKINHHPSDTLKQGQGFSGDINNLFAALAMAAGFDTRLARSPGRNSIFFDKGFPNIDLFERRSIAVNLDGEWRFFDPSAPYVEAGMLNWPEEGTAALLSDPKQSTIVMTPFSEPDRTRSNRQAKLTLATDGTLEGSVQIEYSGHLGVSRKTAYDALTPAERETSLTESIKRRLTTAEISEVEFENVSDLDKPFRYRYKVRIPGYAQVTGKRLFLQPAYFQMGDQAEFPTSTREHDIFFDYAWRENDDVTIALPEGFGGDNITPPGSLSFGEVGEYSTELALDENGTLHFQRQLTFGVGGRVAFPKTAYTQLKAVFDQIHKNDTRLVTLTVQSTSN